MSYGWLYFCVETQQYLSLSDIDLYLENNPTHTIVLRKGKSTILESDSSKKPKSVKSFRDLNNTIYELDVNTNGRLQFGEKDQSSKLIISGNSEITQSLSETILTSSSVPQAISSFYFPGSDSFGDVSLVKFITKVSAGREGNIDIYDTTNQVILCSTSFSNSAAEVLTVSEINNVDAAGAVWEVRVWLTPKVVEVSTTFQAVSVASIGTVSTQEGVSCLGYSIYG